MFIIDVFDISPAQLIPIIINLTLFIIRNHYLAHKRFVTRQERHHIGQRFGIEFKHCIDITYNLVVKIDMRVLLPLQSTSEVITTISYTLNLGHDSKHTVYHHFSFIAQPTADNQVQESGNFQFHTVANLLVFLDTIV